MRAKNIFLLSFLCFKAIFSNQNLNVTQTQEFNIPIDQINKNIPHDLKEEFEHMKQIKRDL